MKTNTPQVAVHVGLVTGGSPGDKPKDFLDLGALFDGHIERELSDNRKRNQLEGTFSLQSQRAR